MEYYCGKYNYSKDSVDKTYSETLWDGETTGWRKTEADNEVDGARKSKVLTEGVSKAETIILVYFLYKIKIKKYVIIHNYINY